MSSGDTSGAMPSRRIVFQGLGALGVAAALAACGGGGAGSAAQGTPPPAGTELAKTADIPVNGGLILPDVSVVITQTTAGQFQAFSAICTHAGNTVTSVSSGQIHCAYHGSNYSAQTGAVENGPATAPLAPVTIKLTGDAVVMA